MARRGRAHGAHGGCQRHQQADSPTPHLCCPTVQHTAALVLGRLANCNDEYAAAIVVSSDILLQLECSLAAQNRFSKKSRRLCACGRSPNTTVRRTP